MERDKLITEIVGCYENPERGSAFLRKMELTDSELAGLHDLSQRGYARRERNKINHSFGLLELEVENILERRKNPRVGTSSLLGSDGRKIPRTLDYDYIVDKDEYYQGRYGIWPRD